MGLTVVGLWVVAGAVAVVWALGYSLWRHTGQHRRWKNHIERYYHVTLPDSVRIERRKPWASLGWYELGHLAEGVDPDTYTVIAPSRVRVGFFLIWMDNPIELYALVLALRSQGVEIATTEDERTHLRLEHTRRYGAASETTPQARGVSASTIAAMVPECVAKRHSYALEDINRLRMISSINVE